MFSDETVGPALSPRSPLPTLRAAYKLILWVSGHSAWHLTHGFVHLAARIGLEQVGHEKPWEIVQHVVHHLETLKDWLLVVDGCHGDLRTLTTFLPTLHGSVILSAPRCSLVHPPKSEIGGLLCPKRGASDWGTGAFIFGEGHVMIDASDCLCFISDNMLPPPPIAPHCCLQWTIMPLPPLSLERTGRKRRG